MRIHTIYKSEKGKRVIQQHYDHYLNTLPFDVERTYANTSYGQTHVLVAGPSNGKPLIIFQGGNTINPMTLSWFAPLAKTYRMYAPDTIGHPGYSDENRISAKDHSFAEWVAELMDHFNIRHSAFIGTSYGGGIILRLATFIPDKIDCAVLVVPAGIAIGSKLKIIKDILLPLMLFYTTPSDKYLQRITGVMSNYSMKEIDKRIYGDVFKYVKLELKIPKLTKREELANYRSPTLVIAGKQDIFFPEDRLNVATKNIIPNLTNFKSYDMAHYPLEKDLIDINHDISEFLKCHYSK